MIPLLKLEKWGIIIIFLLFTALHMLYDVTGIKLFTPISAVSESVWEHLKIGFFAGFIYAVFEYFTLLKYNKNFFFAKTVALIGLIAFIVVTFYGYTMILGRNYLIVDILIAFLSGVFSQFISYSILSSDKDMSKYNLVSILILGALVFIFVIFTYYPPNMKIFKSS